MITPAEIRQKAERRYREFLKTWLEQGDTAALFPMPIRFRHIKAGDDLAVAAAVGELRENSKAETGKGYTIEWREIGSRSLGRNRFPDRIFFESELDFLGSIAMGVEFDHFKQSVTTIRAAFPELEPWLQREVQQVRNIASERIAGGLVAVCRYLAENPRPGLFARELPVPVDTKFVERHATKILRPWLDLILPPHTIRADENHFERRFGLGYAEPLVHMRISDPVLRDALNLPHEELALPLSTAAALAPPSESEIIVVENLVNALTFPPHPNCIILAGLGYNANLFHYLEWLRDCSSIGYWGDIDAQGFEILSQFRTWFPQTESLLMDWKTFDQHERFVVPGKPPRSAHPGNLTDEEQALSKHCRRENLRLEQEKIAHAWIQKGVGVFDLSDRTVTGSPKHVARRSSEI